MIDSKQERNILFQRESCDLFHAFQMTRRNRAFLLEGYARFFTMAVIEHRRNPIHTGC